MTTMEEFYRGKNIFITGATGFLGKVVLEKVLRSLETVGTIYILVRVKKDTPPQKRLESVRGPGMSAWLISQKELLPSMIFNLLRERRPDFMKWASEKIRCIVGDTLEENLGISPADMAILTERLHVIIHAAATINFNDPLREALQANVVASLKVLELAKRCPNLVVMSHISTAYTGCKYPSYSNIKEKLHNDSGKDPDELLKYLSAMTVQEADKVAVAVMGKYPNTYTFTKNLSEELLVRHRGSVPLAIIRPTIIGPAYREPVGGWVDVISAATAIFLSCGVGLLKMLPGKVDNIGDQVPVDFVSNAILAISYAMASQNKWEIYHVGTSATNPLTWGTCGEYVIPYFDARPPEKRLHALTLFMEQGPPEFMFVNNPYLFMTLYYIRFKLPTRLFSIVANTVGNQKMRSNANLLNKLEVLSDNLARHDKLQETFRHFTQNQWIFDTTNTERVLHRVLSIDDKRTFNFDFTRIEWPLYLEQFCWGLKKFILKENVPPPTEDRETPLPMTKSGPKMQPMIDDKLRSQILKSKRVLAEIQATAQSKALPIAQVEREAGKILDNMSGNVSMVVVRMMAWFFRKIWRHLYSGVIVDHVGLKKVRDVSSSVPLVLLPTHRSYVDFLIVSYVCFNFGLPLPHIAAGDDFLNIMLVNWIFRHAGAFFMRRTFREDALYRAVFTEYVTRLVTGGYTLEFYLEGTRSRTGKNLTPKLGLLSMVTDTYFDGGVTDLCFVPMALSYDKVVEEEQHVRELLGDPRPPLSLSGLMTTGLNRVRNHKFGRIHIQFAEPISLRRYVQRYSANLLQSSTAFDPFKNKDHRRHVVKDLGFRVLHELNANLVCMTTSLVAALILTPRSSRGIPREVLIAKFAWLRKEIVLRGGRVDNPEGMSDVQRVDYALRLLGNCLDIRRNLVEPNLTRARDYKYILQLGYYAAGLQHVFFLEGCACLALASFGASGVPVAELKSAAMFLLRLLRLENNENAPYDQQAQLAIEQIVARGIALGGDVIKILPTGERAFDFTCSLVWPLVDAYWISAFTLLSLNREMPEKLLLERTQWLAEKLFFDGVLGHFQSCSKPTLLSAQEALRDLKVMERSDKGDLGVAAKYLANDRQELRELCNRIATYRRPLESAKADVYRELDADFSLLNSKQ